MIVVVAVECRWFANCGAIASEVLVTYQSQVTGH